MDCNIAASDSCSSTAQMYEIVNYYLASHTAIEQLNKSLPSKAAELLADLKESRQAVVL